MTHFVVFANETTFQLMLTHFRLKYRPSERIGKQVLFGPKILLFVAPSRGGDSFTRLLWFMSPVLYMFPMLYLKLASYI
uniref:Uncharacterized protein n=1 Tax=Candidatus Kentrum sp. TUN TaxID=2126343 RepID=A0A451A207_9GAMM|nr:MAG: hypothetical protein BECKTUN1418D_GA0071000_11149 [Candidatus Kentron sp. TUN]